MSRYIVAAVITAVVLFLVWYFSSVVAYVLVAAVLAIIGKPLTDLLTGINVGGKRYNLRMPRAVASLITLLTLWAAVLLLFWIFVPIVFQKLNEFSALNIRELATSFQQPLMDVQRFIESVFFIKAGAFSLVDSITQQVTPLLNINLINNLVSSVVGTVGNVLVAAFSISFITFFFLKESHLFYDMVVIVFPKKYEENIRRALDSVTALLIRYFIGIVVESSIMIVLVTSGLLVFGFTIHDALVIGLVVGILNVIPYLGPIIGICIGIFIGVVGATTDISTVGLVLRIAGVILCAQGIDNFVLQPVLYSNRAKAHPLEIFLVILLAGSLAGVLGMLLAIPSYNVIRVFAKEFFYNFRVVQKLTEKI